MTPSTCRCGSPATAARLYPGTETRPLCVSCAAIDRMTIDPTPERSMPLPDHLIGSRAAAIHPHPTVYNHQALALKILDEGHNAVVATPTASGKTLIFMMHTLYLTEAYPGPPPWSSTRQGPGRRPTNQLATGSRGSPDGARVPPTDHRRHANAPTGAAPSTGHRRPRNPRRGPRMAHQNSSRCSTNQVPDQPQSRCHRRGPRP